MANVYPVVSYDGGVKSGAYYQALAVFNMAAV